MPIWGGGGDLRKPLSILDLGQVALDPQPLIPPPLDASIGPYSLPLLTQEVTHE